MWGRATGGYRIKVSPGNIQPRSAWRIPLTRGIVGMYTAKRRYNPDIVFGKLQLELYAMLGFSRSGVF